MTQNDPTIAGILLSKFHDLIAVLQQQMGDPPTGDLTIGQLSRLTEASHNIDGDLIALPLAMVSSIDVNTVFAQGTGSWDNIDRSIDRPINIVQIALRRKGCVRNTPLGSILMVEFSISV
jgi:hypothetical protein